MSNKELKHKRSSHQCDPTPLLDHTDDCFVCTNSSNSVFILERMGNSGGLITRSCGGEDRCSGETVEIFG